MIYFKNGSYLLSTIELGDEIIEDSNIGDEGIYNDSDCDSDIGSVVGPRYLDTSYMTVTVLELIIKNIFRRYK